MTVRHGDGVWTRPSDEQPPIWTLAGPRRDTFCRVFRQIVEDARLLDLAGEAARELVKTR